MGSIEIIIRVERRRKFSPVDRAAVLPQYSEPGATVAGVAQRLEPTGSSGIAPRAVRGKRLRPSGSRRR